MDSSWTILYRLFEAGAGNLAAYLAAHVLLCLLPAFFIAGAMMALIPTKAITRSSALRPLPTGVHGWRSVVPRGDATGFACRARDSAAGGSRGTNATRKHRDDHHCQGRAEGEVGEVFATEQGVDGDDGHEKRRSQEAECSG